MATATVKSEWPPPTKTKPPEPGRKVITAISALQTETPVALRLRVGEPVLHLTPLSPNKERANESKQIALSASGTALATRSANGDDCDSLVGLVTGEIIAFSVSMQLKDNKRRLNGSVAVNKEASTSPTACTSMEWLHTSFSRCAFAAGHEDGSVYIHEIHEGAGSPSGCAGYVGQWDQGLPQVPRDLSFLSVTHNRPGRYSPSLRIHASRAPIMALGVSKRGDLLATASREGNVFIFDVFESYQPVCGFASFYGACSCLDFSLDGSLVAAGCESDCVEIFSIPAGVVTARCFGHHSFVSGVRFIDPSPFHSPPPSALADPSAHGNDETQVLVNAGAHMYAILSAGEDKQMCLYTFEAMPLSSTDSASVKSSNSAAHRRSTSAGNAGEPNSSASPSASPSSPSSLLACGPARKHGRSASQPMARLMENSGKAKRIEEQVSVFEVSSLISRSAWSSEVEALWPLRRIDAHEEPLAGVSAWECDVVTWDAAGSMRLWEVAPESTACETET